MAGEGSSKVYRCGLSCDIQTGGGRSSCSSMCEEIRSAKTTKTKQNLNSGLDRVIGTLEINILEIKTQCFKGGNQNAHIL